jgi:PhnO protein
MVPASSSAEVLIRPIESKDAEAAADLSLQLGYTRPAAAVRRWIEYLRDTENQAAFVATLQDQVVGWIEVSIQRHLQAEPYALISGLVVREGVRGKGIGRKLCERGEQWAWEHGINKVRFTSRSTRAEAHSFYLQSGYQETKTSLVFDKARPNPK